MTEVPSSTEEPRGDTSEHTWRVGRKRVRPHPLKTHVGYLESSEFSCRFEEINNNSALASYALMREQEVFIDGWMLFE